MERAAFDYHEATKHHVHRFARSLGYLDWNSQPNPFRTYDGTRKIPLDTHPAVDALPYGALYDRTAVRPKPIDHASLSTFLRYSVGISAWKQFGEQRWALRVDPSSGNLHPTEVTCILGSAPGLTEGPGVFHYAPEIHALEERGQLSKGAWTHLDIGPSSEAFLVGVCSIHWREAWKYGERAYRYCQHDAGHVLAALGLSAALLGWTLRVLEGVSDHAIAALLGVDREDSGVEAEREAPDFLAVVSRDRIGNRAASPDRDWDKALADARWFGRANRLSTTHVDWPVIRQVHDAALNPGNGRIGWMPDPAPVPLHQPSSMSAHEVILRRRSALAYDGSRTTSLETFLGLMQRTLPGTHAPWDALFWPPCIHLAVFVHRVKGLEPGMYMLLRAPGIRPLLQESTSPEFEWTRPPVVPDHVPLFLLKTGDVRRMAAGLSCNQAIAGDSYFSLGMIAEFAGPIRRWGTWFYRNLFWEAGAVGQVMYLEAESRGDRATGIGCYFDDAVHEVLGLEGDAFQSLYHFTVGSHVDDARLTTLPPYDPDALRASRGEVPR